MVYEARNTQHEEEVEEEKRNDKRELLHIYFSDT
jgi:hypothetical protein